MVNRTSEELAQPSENEKYAAGILIATPERWEDVPELKIEHFFSDRIRSILTSIERVRESGAPVDTGTVAEDLEKRGELANVGDLPYLFLLMESAPQPAHFSHYAKRVIELRKRSDLRKKLEHCIESLKLGEDLETVLNDLDFSSEAISENQFEWKTAAELHASDYQLDYFIKNVFAMNQPMVIGAPQKCNKTNIASDLALSLSTGCPFLGRFHVNGTFNTAFFSCESGGSVLKDNNRRVAKSMNIPPSTIHNLFYCFDIPSLDSKNDLRKIQQFVVKNKIDVLIIDPFYLTANLGNDAGNLFVVGEKLKPLTELMQKTGCTVVLIHHSRKNTGKKEFAEPRMEDLAYSGLPQWMRQWILIDRREAYDGDNPGSHKLWLSLGGSAGHAGLFGLNIEEGTQDDKGGRRWEVDVIPAQEARAESRSSQEQQKGIREDAIFETNLQKVTKALKALGGEATKSKIRNKAVLSPDKTEQALLHLVSDGVIEQIEITATNKQKYAGYKFSRNHSESLVKNSDHQSTEHTHRDPRKGDRVSVCVSPPDYESLENIFPANSDSDNLQEADQ